MYIDSKHIIKTALLTFIIFSSTPARSEEASSRQLRLTIREGIARVMENNLDVTIERLSPRIAEYKIQTELGVFNTDAFGSFKRSDATTPLNAQNSIAAGGLTTVKSETYSLDAGLSGKTSFGTNYSLEVKDDRTASTFSNFQFQYSSFTGVTITQPLLKNFGYDANELQLNIAKKDRDISIYAFRQRVLDTVANYALAYWDLVRVRDELAVRIESEELAETLVEINKKKYEAGATSRLEVTQAEAAAAARKDDVIVAQKAVRDQEKILKLLISKDVYDLRDKEIVPSGDSAIPKPSESLDESFTKATALRPDYLEAKSELEKNRIQIRYSENQRFPRIDVEASYGYNGLGNTFGDSFKGIDSNPQWSLGLALRYPLGNDSALGSLRAARLQADQSILRLKRLEQQVIMNIDSAMKDIKSNNDRVAKAGVATKLTEESLRAEEKKLEAGRSTTYNVLKVQEDLAKVKSNEIAAVVDYNKSLITYHKEKGTLLDVLGVNIAEMPRGTAMR